MRIAIFGAGAIGGLLAARLAHAGHDVTVIARGAHLAAMQTHGLRLRSADGELVVHPHAVESPADAGVQDAVFITVKAHALPPVVERLRPLLGEHTSVVTAMNGLPYWYFHRIGGELEGRTIESVDPGGLVWRTLGPERAIGCIVYPAAELVEPGVVQHVEGDRFTLGEPDGTKSARVQALANALIQAGFKAPVRPRIRDEIWIKLWGNCTFNPISALTHATLDVIATDPGTRALARTMMLEAQAVAERLGITFPIGVDRRIAGAAAVGAHKTSMLQDLERGRPMEIDALVGAVCEVARLVGVSTPMLDAVLALVRQRAIVAGCYPASGGHGSARG